MHLDEIMADLFPRFQACVSGKAFVPPPPKHHETAGDGYGMNELDMEETGPIVVDDAIPVHIHDQATVEMCLQCSLAVHECVCERAI